MLVLVYSPMYLALSQRSKSLLHLLTAVQHLPPQHRPLLFGSASPTAKAVLLSQISKSWLLTHSHHEVKLKEGTVSVFLTLHVGRPIPECMWEPCSRNTGWSLCAVIRDCKGFLSSFPVREQVCCPSIYFSSFIMVLLPFPILLFSLPVPCLDSCPRHCLHFLLWFLPRFLSQFLFACPCPWWDRLVPCSPVFGSNGLVLSLLTLFLSWCW